MSTNRFVRGVATILRETADLRSHSWRNEVSGAGGAPYPNSPLLVVLHRRTLQPVALGLRRWAGRALVA